MSNAAGHFERLVSGVFTRDQVVVNWCEEKRLSSPDIERQIESAWQQRQREAQKKGKLLYPGRLCRLAAYDAQDSVLRLRLGPTDFRELVGTNLSHPQWWRAFGPNYLANALGVHAVVASVDAKLLLFQRNARVAEYPGHYDVCGGHVEPDFDCSDGIPDPFASIAREVHEELAVEKAAITSILCLGLVRNTRSYKPDLVFSIRTSLSSQSMAEATPLGEEHRLVEILDDNDAAIDRFLAARQGMVAPAGLASLTLYRNLR